MVSFRNVVRRFVEWFRSLFKPRIVYVERPVIVREPVFVERVVEKVVPVYRTTVHFIENFSWKVITVERARTLFVFVRKPLEVVDIVLKFRSPEEGLLKKVWGRSKLVVPGGVVAEVKDEVWVRYREATPELRRLIKRLLDLGCKPVETVATFKCKVKVERS